MGIDNGLGLSRIGRVNIKDMALEQLKRFIASGVLKVGERLPSERELAERLGVGRNSVREAIKVLEATGLLESRIGEGTFVTARTGASIGRTIGLKLAAWGGTIVEIIDAREMIEVEASRVAASRVQPAEHEALRAELERMEHAADFQTYLAADMQFHRLVAQASHNAIIARIVADLIDLLEQVLREAEGDRLPTGVESDGSHRQVYEAIVRRDGVAAADAMRQHLQFSRDLWQTIVSLGTGEGEEMRPA
jgi:GntR family transcriptional repressor for pyruvate dehydrogenase complex